MKELPIDPLIPEILKSLELAPNLVLRAAPGSGKTTRVPPALLRANFANRPGPGEILVLEPRRLAAKCSARRVADELGEEVGRTVGYQFRFENVTSPMTRLKFLTEGILMRKLLGDPRLARARAVVLDEFHERHLHTDTALAYLRHLQKTERPDLRIVVMSATLDSAGIAAFLGSAPVVNLDIRPYPVEIHCLPLVRGRSKPLENQVVSAVSQAIAEGDEGDCLVFLPGMGEIRRAELALSEHFSGDPKRPLILPLHGELSRDEQDAAIRRASRRKIILSTNVAETSLTIEGVTIVIDSGLHRMATYSWWSGVPALKTREISRASATQRAGRAGRTAPGRCFRLYTQAEFDSRPPFETPEILRADLCQTILELKAMGVSRAQSLEWLEPPPPASLAASERLLFLLGALDSPLSALTPLGHAMARFPAHPRISRLILEASHQGCVEEAATLASLLAEGRIERVDPLDCLGQPMSEGSRKSRAQLLLAAREARVQLGSQKFQAREDALRFSILVGYPDRVSRKRETSASAERARKGRCELVFASGGSAAAPESPLLASSELFVTLDLRENQYFGQMRARLQAGVLSSIGVEWLLELKPSLIEERDEHIWNADRERVMRARSLGYGELTLEESLQPASPGPESARVLMRSTLGLDPERMDTMSAQEWIAALSRLTDADKIESAFARVALLKKHRPDLCAAESGRASLLSVFSSRVSAAELKEADWPSEITAALAPQALGQLERILPEAIPLPSGRRVKIQYSLDKPPFVESRLQDFFGMEKGPTILGGKLQLTLHLLAPNGRAVQVTTDLAGFWARGYREQRNALSRRYPRHAWPENPLKP